MAVLLEDGLGPLRQPHVQKRTSVAGLIRIIRPKTTAQAVLYTLLGAYLQGGLGALATARAWGAALVVGLSVAFSFVVNDRCDLPIDRLSKPDRPLPSGMLSPRGAALYATTLALIALVVAWLLGPLLSAIALATLALSVLYSYHFKNTVLLGNAAVAVLDATIVLFGAAAVGYVRPVILLLSSIMALYALAEEILFTLKD